MSARLPLTPPGRQLQGRDVGVWALEWTTVTIRAYAPPLEGTGPYGQLEAGLLHRVPTRSEKHLSPNGRQGTPSTASRREVEVDVCVGGESGA
ncbi:hypothetical protein ACFVP3_36720 [Streptomyces sp. NPDC057806]|uniref:hypothetical protein n=1 Tax=Streptomyces sp. NPDC057806 TaxID=3346255 RepID=UPI0036968571